MIEELGSFTDSNLLHKLNGCHKLVAKVMFLHSDQFTLHLTVAMIVGNLLIDHES